MVFAALRGVLVLLGAGFSHAALAADTPLPEWVWGQKLAQLLPWADWLALIFFFLAWTGYVGFARRRAQRRPSLLATTNRYRREWMWQSTFRDVRVVDGVVIQNLSTSPSFFASTTILIIGGVLAALVSTEKTTDFVRDLPFLARTSALVFDLKLVVLLGLFMYAFFRFTWSMRQYTFGALLMASAPSAEVFAEQPESLRAAFADRAGGVVALAAETFNDGLRAYYLSFAVAAWFFSPLAFAMATMVVVYVLFQREFHSDVLGVLRHDAPFVGEAAHSARSGPTHPA